MCIRTPAPCKGDHYINVYLLRRAQMWWYVPQANGIGKRNDKNIHSTNTHRTHIHMRSVCACSFVCVHVVVKRLAQWKRGKRNTRQEIVSHRVCMNVWVHVCMYGYSCASIALYFKMHNVVIVCDGNVCYTSKMIVQLSTTTKFFHTQTRTQPIIHTLVDTHTHTGKEIILWKVFTYVIRKKWK